MRVFLVDGTYELFRQYFARPSHVTAAGEEVAATRAALAGVLSLISEGATHVGVASDHIVESFRNEMWAGYKTGAGVPAELFSQFSLLEEGLEAMGVVVWPMVELEADDALASAAAVAVDDPDVEQVAILTPDKDLGQCVTGARVVQVDRRRGIVLDEQGIIDKWGVPPGSIPDLLALIGDSADGYPGLRGWGKSSAAAVLARYLAIEAIPDDPAEWDGVAVRGRVGLASELRANRNLAMLFKELATLRIDRSLLKEVDDLQWHGPTGDFEAFCKRVDGDQLLERAAALAA